MDKSIIVICHKNQYLSSIVNRIYKQKGILDEIIIIADNPDINTKKELAKIINITNVKVVFAIENGNRSKNRNLGARLSQNELLVFFDGDIFCQENCFEQINLVYNNHNEEVLIGPIVGLNSEIEHFKLSLGIKNIDELLCRDIYSIGEYSIFADKRLYRSKRFLESKYNWSVFYSAFFVVNKDIFFRAGGFDEMFSSWGAEDIDFGYRLSKITNIVFTETLCVLHLPHKRGDDENYSNRLNQYKMLTKYCNFEMENLICFGNSIDVYDLIEKIISIIKPLTYLVKDVQLEKVDNNEMYIMAYSGDANLVYKKNNIKTYYSLFGIALPFRNNEIDCIFIDNSILLYPEPIIAYILQECCRVSKKVLLKRGEKCLIWDKKINDILSTSAYNEVIYLRKSLRDFVFIEQETNFQVMLRKKKRMDVCCKN